MGTKTVRHQPGVLLRSINCLLVYEKFSSFYPFFKTLTMPFQYYMYCTLNSPLTSSRFSSVLSGPSSTELPNLRKLLICAALMLISVVRLSGSSSMATSSWSGITPMESSGSSSCRSSMVVDNVDRLSGPGMLFLCINLEFFFCLTPPISKTHLVL